MVALLRGQGMSTRAIGAATGVSYDTVQKDLAGDRNLSPKPVTGLDGKTYTRSEPKPKDIVDVEVIEEPTEQPCPHCAGTGKVSK